MTALVTGIYKQGKIELLETPTGLREGRVRILLIEEPERKAEPRYLQPGKYGGQDNTTLADFKAAGWHGEEDFDDLHGG